VAELETLLQKTHTVLDKRFVTQLSSPTPPPPGAPSKPGKQ